MSDNVCTLRERFPRLRKLDLPERRSESFYIEAEP